MSRELIKQGLLNNEHGVYSVIVANHIDKLLELKPAWFIKWLALEYDVPVEKIIRRSIVSAKQRYDKKHGDHPPKNEPGMRQQNDDEPKKENGFTRDVFAQKKESGAGIILR